MTVKDKLLFSKVDIPFKAGGEQSWLNALYPLPEADFSLGITLDAVIQNYVAHPELWKPNETEIAVVHFAGEVKPWMGLCHRVFEPICKKWRQLETEALKGL